MRLCLFRILNMETIPTAWILVLCVIALANGSSDTNTSTPENDTTTQENQESNIELMSSICGKYIQACRRNLLQVFGFSAGTATNGPLAGGDEGTSIRPSKWLGHILSIEYNT